MTCLERAYTARLDWFRGRSREEVYPWIVAAPVWLVVVGLVLVAAVVWVVRRPDVRPEAAPAMPSVADAPSRPAPAFLTPRGEAPTPTSGGSIEGRVLDPEGRPVNGAMVSLGRSRGAQQSMLSGADGSFRFVGLTVGPYRLSAIAPGFGGASRGDVHPVEGPLARGIELRLTRAGVRISGRVLDAGGGPIPGARVRVQASRRAPDDFAVDTAPYETEAGADGSYELRVAPARVSVHVQADGYVGGFDVIELTADEVRDFVLQPPSRVAGRVVKPDRTPVAGAQVQLLPHEGSFTRVPPPVRRGDDGAFQFPSVLAGRYHLRATREGLTGQLKRPLTVGSATHVDKVEIVVTEGLRLEGTVTSKTGRPVGYAKIQLWSSVNAGLVPISAVADPDGRYVVSGLFADEYRLRATADGHTPSSQMVNLTRSDRRNVVLAPSVIVEGVVLDPEGRPVAGATVSAVVTGEGEKLYQRTSSRTNGQFKLDQIGPGLMTITAGKGAWATRLENQRVVPAQPLTLRLGSGARLSGFVRFDDGTPAPGARVMSSATADGAGLIEVRAGQDGAFTMSSLMPGPVNLLALQGQDPITFRSVPRPEQAQLTVHAGEHKTGVVLTLPLRRASLRGMMVDERGQPVAGVQVIALPELDGKASRSESVRTLSAADGSFTLDKLRSVPHTVRTLHPDHADLETPHVPVGAQPLRLRLGARTEAAR
jgi:large repetitive protein